MSSEAEAEATAEYAFTLQIPTRWGDNDIYGHVNNVEYFAFFDTVINHWLIAEGGLDIHRRRGDRPVRRVALRTTTPRSAFRT